MIKTLHPRLVIPATMAVLGTAIAIASWIGSGWASAVGVEFVTVIATAAYYVLGGRDSDFGALFGSRPDERQASVSVRATALAANALVLLAIGGVIVSTAMGALVWPFLLFGVVGACTYMIGLVIYRHRWGIDLRS
jgi:hypothetical protein